MSEINHPTGRQVAAARTLAGLSQAQVASAARISLPTLRRMEAAEGPVVGMPNNVAAVLSVLTQAGVQFVEDGDTAGGPGVVLRLPARQTVTEAEMRASAEEVRSQAADAVDAALIGSDATPEQKAERRGSLTNEPAVVGKARGKASGVLRR